MAKWLTIVFKAGTPEELDNARRILRETQEHWSAASWSHAIEDRDDLQEALTAKTATDGVSASEQEQAMRYGNCDYWCPACYEAVSKPEHKVITEGVRVSDEAQGAAVATLAALGYTFRGGDFWHPPEGTSPVGVMVDAPTLPPLPEPGDTDGCTYAAYTDDQMREYALAALAAYGVASVDPMAVLRELVEAKDEYAHYRSSDGRAEWERRRDRHVAAWKAAHEAVADGVALPVAPRFQKTYCSQCGGEFGPGNQGFSHCDDHGKETPR